MLSLTPRPEVAKREGSPCPKWVAPFSSASADWPFADHSDPVAKPAAPVAKPAAACFRNRLRPNRLESMIVFSRDPDPEFLIELWANELCPGPNVLANQRHSVEEDRQPVNRIEPTAD